MDIQEEIQTLFLSKKSYSGENESFNPLFLYNAEHSQLEPETSKNNGRQSEFSTKNPQILSDNQKRLRKNP